MLDDVFAMHAGIIIPPIPEKNPMQKIQTSPRFLRDRRTALDRFINRVVSRSCQIDSLGADRTVNYVVGIIADCYGAS